MARKDNAETAHARGMSDIIGLVLLAGAVLLLMAQWSFDWRDLSELKNPPHSPPHNWIGAVGAHGAYAFFRLFGAAAYALPLLLLFFGLSFFWEFIAYLRRRWWSWVAAAMLMVCITGLLGLYTGKQGFLANVAAHLNASSAGGLVGDLLNQFIFLRLGKPGATVIYLVLYVISLYFLTNFELGIWIREWLARRAAKEGKEDNLTPEERELARRARELEEKARELQEMMRKPEKNGKEKKGTDAGAAREETGKPVGPDLKPVPEPVVRDLTATPTKPANGRKEKTAPEKAPEPPPKHEAPAKPAEPAEPAEGREVPPATVEQILGRESAAKPKETAKEKAEPPAVEIHDGKTPAQQPETPAAAAAETVEAGATAAASADNPFAAKSDAAGLQAAARQETAPPIQRAGRKTKPLSVATAPRIENYQLPSIEFLQPPEVITKPTESKEELLANAQLMKNTLAQFDIEVAIGDITKGPTITRYELHPAPGVKLEKITALSNNIAAALKAERIHILAPVPGKSSVGVEVPNAVKTKVYLRDVLESEEWINSKARIPLALGKDVYGHPIVADLAEMPHLLIAGSTGSGKSVCINCIVASLLYRFRPDELRFVMIDPKVVELQHYNPLPHLVVPVVTDPKKVILALRWVIDEMEKRYKIFAKVGVRNIKSFNDRPRHKPPPQQEPELPLTATRERIKPASDGFAVEINEEIVVPRDDDIVIPDKLSYIVVIIDELADLMLVAPADVEMAIARITQMARAAGIHCIVATQRPSVDVITGVIKANIPARIAFQVAAKVDSRTILDAMGADKLLGKGDMLYLPPGSAKLIRAQGALITDPEIQKLVEFISKQGKPSYDLEIHQQLQKPASALDNENSSDEDEELIEQCIEVIRSEQKASVSLLQRRLRLGYGRAARIMDELERRGIVGPSKGAEPRDILIDLDGTGMDGRPRDKEG